MAETKNSGLWLAVITLGSLAAYEWWKKKQAQAEATAVENGTATPAIANANATTLSNVNYPSSGTTAPSLLNPGGIPVVQNPDNGISLPPGISQTQFTNVQEWGLNNGTPAALAIIAAGIASEYQGLNDLLTTVWANGGSMTTAQTTFWNNLRAKYDPQHKYL